MRSGGWGRARSVLRAWGGLAEGRGRTFRHWPPKTYPRPSRDAAPQGVVFSLTRRLYAESHNVEGGGGRDYVVKRFRKIVFRAEAGRVVLAACCEHAASMAGVGAFGVRGRVRPYFAQYR